MAAGVLIGFGTVQYKQSIGKPETDDQKARVGNLMFYHKSFGLLMALMLAPRLATRMFSQIPKQTAGIKVQHTAAKLSHLGTYFLLTGMTATGVGMGYFSGGGVPFFVPGYEMPGAAKED